tara:strand:+ start:70139 stop:70768 length:630 start_codon:yes stop_codon:yes gene_type:complete
LSTRERAGLPPIASQRAVAMSIRSNLAFGASLRYGRAGTDFAKGTELEKVVLARVEASAGRRVFGIGVLALLAIALVWLGVSPQPVSPWMRLLVFAIAIAVAFAGWSMYRATMLTLELTEAGLYDSAGHLLAPLHQIAGVDRGTFAFKPSNGFLLRLSAAGPRRFLPGLYWQLGRRIGVGGVLRGSETKQMADVIAIHLAERAAAEGAE